MFEQLNQGLPKLPTLRSYRNLSPIKQREMREGLLFISPWLIGFLAFTLLPMVASMIFSFMELNITDGILSSPKFIGFANYAQMASDPQIWSWGGGTRGSLWITVLFGAISLPIGIFVPLGLALLLNNEHVKAQSMLRSLFYMPYIVPFVAAVFLWGGMLNPETGWINRALMGLGMPRSSVPNWANDVNWVYPTYVIMGIWGVGNAMLIMLAGLQGVPTELYNAAKVDGANAWQSFWNVTFPMISPVIFYNLVLSVVGVFQYFLVPLVVNNGTGRPGGATMFFNLYLYKTFFTFQNMSYGSALAWLLFALILVVTSILFGTSRYWVYYAGDSRA
ncbi:MAG: sugar ABC transporter permease [Caldilineaceae bacterium]|nr:sugar ABC transporter permease [Caldilineaceae bacterium]MBP8110608.1 sugar ABC transporter permease [Caldilineaceae bacterium]MBP8125820.1 sugar ABC transporter permease [Caldilineaceae bacterium]MBP9074924.1 sugar ABC transporter permease [Caldilineaceae bacterium]